MLPPLPKAQTSNDYSVCATWCRTSDGDLYLIDLLRKKMEWPELVRTAEDHYSLYNPNSIRIEDRASGQSLIQELRTKKLPVVAVGVDQDKWRRASAVTGIVEAGYCYLPDYSDWVGDFIEEHAQFSPLPKDYDYDDQVDTTSMALAYFKPRILSGGRGIIISESKGSVWRGSGLGASGRGVGGQGVTSPANREHEDGLTLGNQGNIMSEMNVG